ncbi:Predicted small membrane protein [Plasmopara halstedii]|uniref:Predicted small membrane protein n=1 Tax=Plasmopara halstedii TaxID=4781 RepID=A0A0P1A5V0_PLAHL|nr:Predicted small membrane protein [Plasmopara halstedii]CEG35726.1 Predicted small membrane protein [Plasmopara halstedii]|eukprot:XP_024572095.1 Predicted small membrane protein [Plasmopara halstedii]
MKASVISPAASIWWKLGALSGATGILLGAFGAHGLKKHVKDPHMLKNWETAAHYQLIHSVVLLAAPMSRRPTLAGGFIAGGTLLFSGSLYVMTLTEQKKLGMITPIGGIALIAGWLALFI